MKRVCIFLLAYFVLYLCMHSHLIVKKIAPHPRLLWPLEGDVAIKKMMAEYPQLANVHERILSECAMMLLQKPVERILRVNVYWVYLDWHLNVFFIFHTHTV